MSRHYLTVTTDVDVDISDFDTEDLIEEIKYRAQTGDKIARDGAPLDPPDAPKMKCEGLAPVSTAACARPNATPAELKLLAGGYAYRDVLRILLVLDQQASPEIPWRWVGPEVPPAASLYRAIWGRTTTLRRWTISFLQFVRGE